MKNYSEQRGVLSQTVYDAASGQFQQCTISHEFERLAAANTRPLAPAAISELVPRQLKSEDTVSSRKSRKPVMQPVQNRRAG